MRFCERFPEIAARYERLWAGEETDRPLLYISKPKAPDRPVAPPPKPANPTDRFRPEHLIAAARHNLATTAWFAEGFPHCFVNFGPGVIHAALGGKMEVRDDSTVWFPPFLDNVERFPELRFDPESRAWRQVLAATDALLDAVGDEMVVSITDIGGNADVLASALGTERFMMECLDRPAAVKAGIRHCHELWWQAYESNLAVIAGRQDVTVPWWPMPARGRTYITQCDVSAMIGPEAFRELFAEELGATWKKLDRAAYHLDGVGTEVHVPALLEAGGLHCLQWVPPPGVRSLKEARMLREIQERGVSITLRVQPAEVPEACRLLDARRLMLLVRCNSERQARQVIEEALRNSG